MSARPHIALRNMGTAERPDMRFCFVIADEVHVFPFGTTWEHVQDVMQGVKRVLTTGEDQS